MFACLPPTSWWYCLGRIRSGGIVRVDTGLWEVVVAGVWF